MGEGSKCTFHHLVLKMGRVGEIGDFYRQILIDAKMFGSPSNYISSFTKTCGSSRNSFFICFFGRSLMYFNASGKIKAYLLGSIDFCMEMDGFQGVCFCSGVSIEDEI